jgi:hypothetical protein
MLKILLGGHILNRNEIIGTLIGKTLGYAVQGVIVSELINSVYPQSGNLIRTEVLVNKGARYGLKLLNSTAQKYVRTDFKSEKIFSDFIDASFFAD